MKTKINQVKLLSLCIVFSILLILSIAPMINAWELNPFADKKIYEPTSKADMSSFIKEDFNPDYGVIKLSKTLLWIETDKIAEYSLTKNTKKCVDCEQVIKTTLYEDMPLYDNIKQEILKGNNKQLNLKTYLLTDEEYFIEVPDIYKEICDIIPANEKNGTKESKYCYDVVDTYKKESYIRQFYIPYNGEILKAGNYQYKITGKIGNGQTVDIVQVSDGQSFDEWTIWTSADCVGFGGNITIDGDYCVHTFLVNDTFNTTKNIDAEILIVAGGGAGGIGGAGGGGGGAGGLYYLNSLLLTPVFGKYNITIGVGGQGVPSSVDAIPGNNGTNSSFGTYQALGGGGGGSYQAGNGASGGSGGGGGSGEGSSGNGGAGYTGQGFWGGTGHKRDGNKYQGGGGGGSSQNGSDGAYLGMGGAGGNGTFYNITGNNSYFAGGGGGSGWIAGGAGGLGGGGQGASAVNTLGQNGTNGFGGGGGGTAFVAGIVSFDGGSGVVIVRYLAGNISISMTVSNSQPVNNLNTFSNSITFGCNVTGVVTNITSIKLNATNGAVNWLQTITGLETTQYNATFINATLSDGSYNWTCYGYGNLANATGATWTFFKDTIFPVINITYPQNQYYNNITPYTGELNYTLTEANPSSCWYNLNGGSNASFICGQNITGINATQGNSTLTVYINDTANNINSSTVLFFLDYINPIINLTFPLNNSYLNNDSVNLTYEVNETTNPWLVGVAPSAYYKFDGDNLDSSGNNLTLVNQVFANNTFFTGKVNQAISLDTTQPNWWSWPINHSYSPNYQFDINNFSVCFWYNSTMVPTSFGGPGVANAYPMGLYFGIEADGSMYSNSYFSGNYQLLSTVPGMNNGNWWHTCWIREGLGTNQYKVYVNGVNVNNATLGINITALNNWFGMGDSSGRVNLDELVIWNNYALTSSQVTQMYNGGAGRSEKLDINPSGLKNSTVYIYKNETSLCYQEQTNSSTPEDGNCGLNYNGTYTSSGWVNNYLTYDGDWSTASPGASLNVGVLTINYSKPIGSLSNSLWKVKFPNASSNGQQINMNLSINLSCWNYSNMLSLRVMTYDNGNYRNEFYCYDGNNYILIYRDPGNLFGHYFYEEAMIWNIGQILINQTTTTFAPNIFTAIIGIPITLLNGVYQWFADVFDDAGNYAITNNQTFTVDTIFPTFTNQYDDSNNLTNSGVGHFNITVANTNGTVILNINSQNIVASNLTSNVYNVSYTFIANGTYPYYWTAYGNGLGANFNTSKTYNYSIKNVSINLINPLNGTLLSRRNNVTLNVSLSGDSNRNWTLTFYNATNQTIGNTSIGTVYGINTSLDYSYAAIFLSNLTYGQTFKWYAEITDGMSNISTPIYEFTPNNEPAIFNLRIENINLTTVQVFWTNEPNMDWVAFRIGNDIMEVRSITSTTDNWTVTGLFPNQQYIFEYQTGDSFHAISDYHNFYFRTLGWHPGYADYPYRILISTNSTLVGTAKDNYAVNVSLNESNFQFFDGVNWVYYPAFLHLNWTNLNNIRFVDYYDIIPLSYNVTYINIPGQGGLSYQTIPNSNYTTGIILNPENAHDGDWSSYSVPNLEGSFYYNYTIPTGAKTTSMFRISDSGWGWDLQLPSDCYGVAGTDIGFRSDANKTGVGAGYVITYCQNISDGNWLLVRDNAGDGPYFFETMMTWQYTAQAQINVIPYYFNNNLQANVPGIAGNYNTQFWMYYGDPDGLNNESLLNNTGLDNNVLTYGLETTPLLDNPIIFYLNDTEGRTATGTNISWSVTQIVNNRLKIATNPYLLDSYFYSYVTNTTQREYSLYSGSAHTILTLTSPSEYMFNVSAICSNSSYNDNVTWNSTSNPVSIIIPNFNTTEFLSWNFTYQENKTWFRSASSVVWPVIDLITDMQYWYQAIAYGTSGNGTALGNFILGTLPSTPTISILNYSEYRPTKTVTICANLTDMNGNTEVNVSFQYWNQTDITFKEITTTTSCYQETANATNINDGSCGLNYSGVYTWFGYWIDTSAPKDPVNIYDGNWSTGHGCVTGWGDCYQWINYTKPTFALNSSIWRISDGNIDGGDKNYSIPFDCWNYNLNILSFRVFSQRWTDANIWSVYSCYNGTTWNRVNSGYAGSPMEEAMIWNVTSNTINTTGPICADIPVNFGEINSYRAKAVGATTGYSASYTNEIMPIQEFFAGNTVQDNNDAPMTRQYCAPNPDGTANIAGTCYEQKGYREGSLQAETSMYVETNVSAVEVFTLHLYYLNGTLVSNTVMTPSAYGFEYLTLDDLGQNWYTFYITNSTNGIVLNWTKPGMTHLRTENRKDTSKYVSFNGTTSIFNYTIFYFNDPGVYNTSVYQWCQAQPGGNLFDCMSAQYWGTSGMAANLGGTAYDRGQFFRGGTTNGEEKDSGLLNYVKSPNAPLGDTRQCFAFTVYYFDESMIPINNITNYHYVYWTETEHFSDFNGKIEPSRFHESYLFNFEYDVFSATRDWKAYTGTSAANQTIVKSVGNTIFNSSYNQTLVVGEQRGFNVELKNDNQYNFGLYLDGDWSNQQIGKYQQAYILFNLPDNATLTAMDSDSDGLTDFYEIYTSHTNPKSSDTDEDKMLDKAEIDNGFDPLLYTSHAGPNITLITPANNSFSNIITQNFTANITSLTGLDSINLYLNNLLNQTYTALAGVTSINIGFIKVLTDGIYNWFYEAIDITGVGSNSSINKFTLDTILPAINITYPRNISYNYIPTDINYTFIELYPALCWYSIDGGSSHYVLTCGNNVTGLTAVQGTNIWGIRMEDNATNQNGNYTTFFVDSIVPLINFTNPTETSGTYLNRSNIQINITASDTNLMNISIKVYNSSYKQVGSSTWTDVVTNNFWYNFISSYDDIYYFNATVVDILGNYNKTETRNVTIDTIYPIINYSSPTIDAGGPQYTTAIWSNMSANDTNLYAISSTLELVSGVSTYTTNTTFKLTTAPSDSLYYNWTGLLQGIYKISGYANDLAGHFTYIENRTVNIDTMPPVIAYEYPTETNGTIVTSINAFTINVSALDPNFANQTIYYWYTNGTVQTQTTTSLTNTLTQSSLIDGIYYYNVSATDTQLRVSTLPTRSVDVQYANQTVTACRGLSVSGATYVIQSNLSTNGTCLNVTGANIKIYCGGYSITGNAAIRISNTGVTLRDCVIFGYNFTTTALQVKGNSPASVSIFNSNFSGGLYGIYVAPEAGITADNVYVFNNTYGIYFNSSGNGNRITSSNFANNTQDTLTLLNTQGNYFASINILTAADFSNDGVIKLVNSSDNYFTGSSFLLTPTAINFLFYLSSYSVNNTIYSSNYPSGLEFTDGTSQLMRSWAFNSIVQDKAKNKLQGAKVAAISSQLTNITVNYSTGKQLSYGYLSDSSLTNSPGQAYFPIIQYMNVFGTTITSNPYDFTITYLVFTPLTTSLTITNDTSHTFTLSQEIASNSMTRTAMWLLLGIIFLIGLAAGVGFFMVRMREGYSVVDIWKYFIILVIWLVIFTILFWVLAWFIMGSGIYPQIPTP